MGIPAPLPMLYNSHQQSHTSYGAHYEHEAMRSQQTTPDHHHRYSSGGSTISPSPYPSSSPIGSYSQPHYYSYGTNSRPTTAGYAPQPASQGEARAPFSPTGPVELSMDHFDQARSGKRRRGNLPKQVTDLLRSWLNDHLHHPYPTEDEKQMLMNQTGLTIHQVSSERSLKLP